jgi:hypothetical protein
VYDDAGVLVRTVTSRESEWCPREVALLLASRVVDADRGPHGEPLSESTSKLADPANADAEWFYEGSQVPVVDYAAKALADAEDAYRARLPKDAKMPHGLHFYVTKVPLV